MESIFLVFIVYMGHIWGHDNKCNFGARLDREKLKSKDFNRGA